MFCDKSKHNIHITVPTVITLVCTLLLSREKVNFPKLYHKSKTLLSKFQILNYASYKVSHFFKFQVIIFSRSRSVCESHWSIPSKIFSIEMIRKRASTLKETKTSSSSSCKLLTRSQAKIFENIKRILFPNLRIFV